MAHATRTRNGDLERRGGRRTREKAAVTARAAGPTRRRRPLRGCSRLVHPLLVARRPPWSSAWTPWWWPSANAAPGSRVPTPADSAGLVPRCGLGCWWPPACGSSPRCSCGALATWVAMAGIGAQMNSHDLTVLGCLILLATGVLLEVLATRTRARIRRWSTCSPASCGPGPGELASLPRGRGWDCTSSPGSASTMNSHSVTVMCRSVAAL
jgi:hypothetical protein